MSIDVDKDMLLRAMCDKLPALDQTFTLGDQERWLDAMRAILAFLYPPEWSQEARRKAKEGRTAGQLLIPRILIQEPDGTVTEPVAGEPTTIDLGTVTGPSGPPPWTKIDPEPDLLKYVVAVDQTPLLHEEAPSTTSADAVDDADSSAGAPTTTGAEPAGDTSSTSTPDSPPESEPTSPSSDETAPAKRSSPRYFTADQKGAIIKRAVREGTAAVADDLLVHQATINRWMREMPVCVATFTEEWVREQAEALGGPTVEQMEAERNTPIPERVPIPERDKPAVQWPTTPIERRPVDPERIRRDQAGQS